MIEKAYSKGAKEFVCDYKFCSSVFGGGTERLILTKLRKSILLIEGIKSRGGKKKERLIKEVKLNGKVKELNFFGDKVMDIDVDELAEIVKLKNNKILIANFKLGRSTILWWEDYFL